MKHKKRNIFFSLILFIYAITIITHSFFSNTKLNQILSSKLPFVYFYSFPILFGFIMAIFSVFILLILYCFSYRRKKCFYKTSSFIIWIGMLVLSVLYIIFGTNQTKQYDTTKNTDKTFKLVEWNTQNNMTSESINIIFGQYDADIAIFPELESDADGKKGALKYERLKELFKNSKIDRKKYKLFTSYAQETNVAPVTIVVKKSFGTYKQEGISHTTPMTTFGTLYLQSKNDNEPKIIGLHTCPPLPGGVYWWNYDMSDIYNTIIKQNPNAIIAGDFNATMRHGVLSKIDTHEDVLDYVSPLERGTWNTSLPACFRTTIDHILIPKNQYAVKKVEVKDIGNSDHMCVVAELALKK